MGIGLRERADNAVRPLGFLVACLTLLLASAALSPVAGAAVPGALIWEKVIGGSEAMV